LVTTVALVPLYSAVAKFITIDVWGLFDILMEAERHRSNKRCTAVNGCERCKDRKPIKRAAKDLKQFRWHRIKYWLESFKIPQQLLLGKDEEAVPGQSYFNSLLSTNGFGASMGTFKWTRKAIQDYESGTVVPSAVAPSTTASKRKRSSQPWSATQPQPTPQAPKRGRGRPRKPSTQPPPVPLSSTASSYIASSTTVSRRKRSSRPQSTTQPPPAPSSSETSTATPVVPSTAITAPRRGRPPKSAAGSVSVAERVIASARARRPSPEPPPPAYVQTMAEITANPYAGVLTTSASPEAIAAMIASISVGLAERTAALDESRAIRNAFLAEGEAAARWAATADFAEYYAEDRRNAVYKACRENITIAYEETIKAAEAAAGPELERTTHQANVLHVARCEAMATALRKSSTGHSVAVDVVDSAKLKAAATLAAIRDPNHVHIGGDPGVKDFATFSRFDIRWSYSISAKQYHADSENTWPAAEMSKLIDRLGLRLWMSEMPMSNAATSEGILELLRYLFKTENFAKHMDMHQMLRVRIMRWRAYEQQQSTIASYCNKVTAGCTRENTTIDMGNAKLHNMRGCLPCPGVKKLVNYWRRTGWRVVMVNEFNTSQVYSTCMMRLPADQAPVKLCALGDEHTKVYYKARLSNNHFARHFSVCFSTWNRDVNAARNMAYLGYLMALGLPRPWFFQERIEHPPVHYQVLYHPLVSRNPLLLGDQAPFPACKPAPVYQHPAARDAVLPGDQAPLPACALAYRPHRVRHYAYKTQPSPKPVRELSPRFEPPLPRRSLPQDDQGPFPACARRGLRLPKPQNERSRWMPTAVRAGQLRQAASVREARRLAADPSSTDGPGPAALKRMAVADKHTAQARAVIAALYESARSRLAVYYNTQIVTSIECVEAELELGTTREEEEEEAAATLAKHVEEEVVVVLRHQGGHDDRDNKEKKKRDAIFDLKKYTDKSIRVKFMGGREVTGILKGSDQLLNIVLDDAKETIRDTEDTESSETRLRHIGLVVLRGPSIILVSPTDGSEEIENPFVQAE
ncbi:U6 snRNP-associated protein Lsm7, partial [Coemansia sp. S146]